MFNIDSVVTIVLPTLSILGLFPDDSPGAAMSLGSRGLLPDSPGAAAPGCLTLHSPSNLPAIGSFLLTRATMSRTSRALV